MEKLDTLISKQEQIMSNLEKVLTKMNCLETSGTQEDGCNKRQREETEDVPIPVNDIVENIEVPGAAHEQGTRKPLFSRICSPNTILSDHSYHFPSTYIIQHLKDLSSTLFSSLRLF